LKSRSTVKQSFVHAVIGNSRRQLLAVQRFVFQVERVDRRIEVLRARPSIKPAIRGSISRIVKIDFNFERLSLWR
jgi:hypothetical protein